MDLNEVYIFTQVVQARSFRAAAAAMDIPKSTVSRKVQELEDRLGVRLLQRTTRKIGLTAEGEVYYERCIRALEEIQQAGDAVTGLQTEAKGLLRVTAPVEFGRWFLDDFAVRFLQEYPDIQLDLMLSDRIVDLVGEGIDLALRAGSALPDSTLVARGLGRAGAMLIASREYAQSRGLPEEPDDLLEHECIVFSSPSEADTWRLENTAGMLRRVRVHARYSVNEFGLCLKAALGGLGIAMAPGFLANEAIERGELVRVLPNWHLPESKFWAVYPSAKNLSTKVRVFLDALLDELGPNPWASAEKATAQAVSNRARSESG